MKNFTFGGWGVGEVPQFKNFKKDPDVFEILNLNLNNYWQTYENVVFKLHQNRTKQEFDLCFLFVLLRIIHPTPET